MERPPVESNRTMPRPGVRTRRVVIAKKVTAAEYEKHRERMEALGLDPSDPAPCDGAMAQDAGDAAWGSAAAAPAQGGGYPATAGAVLAEAAMGSSSSATQSRTVRKRPEPKKVSLQRRTIGEQVAAGRHERALVRFQAQQAKWDAIHEKAAKKTGRAKEHLVVSRAEEHRERLEVMELLDRATPGEAKSGGHSWYHSLRGDGTRYVQVGNMFSGLFLPIKLHKERYEHEIVRKPILRDLVMSRVDEQGNRRGIRTWRDDEYLLQRLGRHRKKMEELTPGQLGHHELLEPAVVPLKALQDAEGLAASAEVGEDRVASEEEDVQEWQQLADDDDGGEARRLSEGPHLEASPGRLQFQAGAGELCTRSITLRNSGTAAVAFEWVRDPAQHSYQEAILPDDSTDRFTCKQARDRILPGRETTIYFSFSSRTPGVFTTSWSLSTRPELLEPITGVVMHGVATQGDLLQEKREALQASLREQQILHQAQELVDDIVDAVKLRQPRLPEDYLENTIVQERLFEDANRELGLHYTPHAWETLRGIAQRLDAFKARVAPPPRAGRRASTADENAAAPKRALRGRVPEKKPPVEPIVNALAKPVSLGAPSAQVMLETLEALPPSSAAPPEIQRERQEIAVELAQAIRAASQPPLERSPIWWLAYETVTDIVMSIPGKVKSTRRMYSLENWPFIPPLHDGASPEEEADFNAKVEAREAAKGEAEPEAEWKAKLLEKVGNDCFGPRLEHFSATAATCLDVSRIRKCAGLSFRDRLQTYLDRQSVESIEMGATVLLYEMDLGLLELKMAAGEGPPKLSLEDGDDVELVKQRLAGVSALLDSSPLAVLVVAHLGTPKPDVEEQEEASAPGGEGNDGAPADEEAAESPMLAGIAARMRHLPSLEPLRDLLADIVAGAASSVEFVPHEVWLGDAEGFAERVRSDLADNKVFILENLSAFPEELGVQRLVRVLPEPPEPPAQPPAKGQPPPSPEPKVERVETKLLRLPWATREGWAQRAFGQVAPDIFVQDAFSTACRALTTHCGLWRGAPQRYLGPFVEAELAAFLDVLGLPFKSGETRESGSAGGERDETGSARPPAPLTVVVGGGGFGEAGGEEALFRKLELLIGLARLAKHEADGVSIALGGEVAVAVLACALGAPVGEVGAYAAKGSMRVAMLEALLEILRHDEVTLRLPIDLVCEELPPTQDDEPPPPPDPKDKKKGSAPSPVPQPPPIAPLEERTRTFPLSPALASVARTPVSLGCVNGEEYFLQVDPEEGLLSLRAGAPPEAAAPEDAEGALAAEGADEAPADPPAEAPPAEAPPAEAPPAGIPSGWVVRDIGERTVECLRATLRRSRGVIWNGALGRMEDEPWQKGTRAFLTAVEARLAGEDDIAADEAAVEENDEEDEEEEEEEEEEVEIDFDVAVVIGSHSCLAMPTLITPSLISFASQSGEGLLSVLRGAPLPGLMACVEKEKGHR